MSPDDTNQVIRFSKSAAGSLDIIANGGLIHLNVNGNVGIDDGAPSAKLAIDQDNNVTALSIDAESTTENVMTFLTPTTTTATIFAAVNANSLTTGRIAYFHSDSSTTDARNLVEIGNDNASATGATCLHIDQDANQKSITIDSEATTNHVIRINTPATTTGAVILLDDVDALTTGNMMVAHSNSDDTGARKLVQIHNDHASATGAIPLHVIQDAAAPAITTNGGGIFVNESLNANQSLGITINQGGHDNEILTFKSEGDIAHGVTATTETDTFGRFLKNAPNDGGLRMDGFADAGTPAFVITGLSPSDDATRSTSAPGVVEISAIKKNGSNPDDRDANKNIVVFKNRNTTRFIWNSDGDFFADVNSHTFDHYNDAQLARTFDLSQGRGVIQSRFDNFINYNHEKLAELDLVGREKDGTPNTFVNVTGMQRLHNGAIWQQYTEMEKMKELMYDTMVELIGKEQADKKLEKHDIKLLDESLDITDSLWSRTKNKVKSLFKVVEN